MEILKISIMCCDNFKGLPLPAYQTIGSAGVDLLAAIETDIIIQPGQRILVPTGIIIQLPLGYEAQIRPRSGLALKHGITVLNSPGTIDADYRGEIKVILINFGDEKFVVSRGMRIAQMVVNKIVKIEMEEVDNLNKTERSAGGFGHTGF